MERALQLTVETFTVMPAVLLNCTNSLLRTLYQYFNHLYKLCHLKYNCNTTVNIEVWSANGAILTGICLCVIQPLQVYYPSVVSIVSTLFLQAEFFNSYLSDPKRPQVPEGPSPQRPPGNHVGQMYGHQGAQSMMGWAPRPQMMMYGEFAEGSSRALAELNNYKS